MNMIKRGFPAFLGFLLATGAFAGSGALAAKTGGQSLQPVQPGQTMVQKPNQRFHPVFGLLHNLNLTKSQKAQVASVLKSNEAQAKRLAQELASAGVQVRKDFINGTFNADHFNKWVKYERQGARLRANVMAEILPKLTEQQKTTLLSMQDRMGSRITSTINSKFAQLDHWIAENKG